MEFLNEFDVQVMKISHLTSKLLLFQVDRHAIPEPRGEFNWIPIVIVIIVLILLIAGKINPEPLGRSNFTLTFLIQLASSSTPNAPKAGASAHQQGQCQKQW